MQKYATSSRNETNVATTLTHILILQNLATRTWSTVCLAVPPLQDGPAKQAKIELENKLNLDLQSAMPGDPT